MTGRAFYSWRVILPLALAALLAWTAFLTLPDDRVRVDFLDVGQGDAILIRTPSYKVLVDGGPSPQTVARRLGERLPFWDRRIDLIVLTHPHEDHLMGLMEVLQRYQVGGILATPYEHDSTLYRQWRVLIRDRGVRYVIAGQGQEVRLGSEARLRVLLPGVSLFQGTDSDPNNNSVVLRLEVGGFSALLPGDIEEEAQQKLLAEQLGLESQVLKVPHQGARNALSEGFLGRVNPQVAVISVGEKNPFGHPAQETIQKLQGISVFRTDQQGTIEVETDGRGYRVVAERPSK
ncbi:MAG: ComEC/Rec2 family competence protein [Dehalococcoidia bacterium]|nr:ComEC/Rec2 family competence protein [Dehalococcoidia bacterium]